MKWNKTSSCVKSIFCGIQITNHILLWCNSDVQFVSRAHHVFNPTVLKGSHDYSHHKYGIITVYAVTTIDLLSTNRITTGISGPDSRNYSVINCHVSQMSDTRASAEGRNLSFWPWNRGRLIHLENQIHYICSFAEQSIKPKKKKKKKKNLQVVRAAGRGAACFRAFRNVAWDCSHTFWSDPPLSKERTHYAIMNCRADLFTPYRDNGLICQRTEHL